MHGPVLADPAYSTGFVRESRPLKCQETTSPWSSELRSHVGVSEPELQKQVLLRRLHQAGSEWLISELSPTPVPLSALVPEEAAFPEEP